MVQDISIMKKVLLRQLEPVYLLTTREEYLKQITARNEAKLFFLNTTVFSHCILINM